MRKKISGKILNKYLGKNINVLRRSSTRIPKADGKQFLLDFSLVNILYHEPDLLSLESDLSSYKDNIHIKLK